MLLGRDSGSSTQLRRYCRQIPFPISFLLRLRTRVRRLGLCSTKVGYDRFIQPTPPEGWKYNTETGGFELINPPKEEPKPADRVTVLEAKVDALETQDNTLEECIVEIANVVYA